MPAVAGHERGPATQPPHHGEGQFGGGQGDDGECGHPHLEGHVRRPRLAHQDRQCHAEEVRAAVPEVDPGRRPVEQEECDQGRTEGHGQLPTRPHDQECEPQRGDRTHSAGQHVEAIHQVDAVDEQHGHRHEEQHGQFAVEAHGTGHDDGESHPDLADQAHAG